MPMPYGIVPIGLGHHPSNQNDHQFYVYEELLDRLRDDVGWKNDDLRLLEEAIRATPPTTCFQGLKRANYTDAFCYASKPSNPPQQGVFLIFFDNGPAGFAGPTIFDFEWRKEDQV